MMNIIILEGGSAEPPEPPSGYGPVLPHGHKGEGEG